MITIQILHAQVLYINHYKKRQIAIARKHGESKINLKHTIFLQTHGHIIYYYGSTTSYKGRGTTFSIFTPS